MPIASQTFLTACMVIGMSFYDAPAPIEPESISNEIAVENQVEVRDDLNSSQNEFTLIEGETFHVKTSKSARYPRKLQYSDIGDMSNHTVVVTYSPEKLKMQTNVPSKDDEIRMREYLMNTFKQAHTVLGSDNPVFANMSLPYAQCENATSFLVREWVKNACLSEIAKIPMYRPRRDKIKEDGGSYSAGDHFSKYWGELLARDVLFRHLISEHDKDFAADLAIFITRQKQKGDSQIITVPSKKDYNNMLLQNIETVMGHEAYRALNTASARL